MALWDSETGWIHTYDDNDIADIALHLESADTVIGFSSEDFDIPCVEGLLGRKLKIKKSLDLYRCISHAVALTGHKPRKGEYTLGSICLRTFGEDKNDSGSRVDQLIAEGKWGKLTNYCINDVRLTWKLYKHIVEHGGIVSAHGTFLPVDFASPYAAGPSEEA